MSRTFFVRHGDYDFLTGSLTDEGKEQSKAAASELVGFGVGQEALLISSSAKRAVESADYIARALRSAVLQSEWVEQAGQEPSAVYNYQPGTLEWFVDRVVELSEQPRTEEIVIVTHAPLIAYMLDIDEDDVAYGQVSELPVGR